MEKLRTRITSHNPCKKNIADPGAMGLFAFAVVTFTAATAHMGWKVSTMDGVYSPAVAYGGLVQVIAGIIDLIRGEKISGSTFVAFGFYWISQGLWMWPGLNPENAYADPEELRMLKGWYILGWAFVALATFLAMLRTTIVQIVLLGLVTFDFTGLAILNLSPNETFEKILGYILALTALVAWYVGVASLCKDKSPVVLPLFPVAGNDDEDDWENPALKEAQESRIDNVV